MNNTNGATTGNDRISEPFQPLPTREKWSSQDLNDNRYGALIRSGLYLRDRESSSSKFDLIAETVQTEIDERKAADDSLDKRVTVLEDNQGDIDAWKEPLAEEVKARKEGDENLGKQLASETQQRITADSKLTSDLASEKAQRIEADAILTSSLEQEVTDRTNADAELKASLDNETADRKAADNALTKQISQVKTDLDNETQQRITEDKTIAQNLQALEDELGTAAYKDTGNNAGDVVVLGEDGKISDSIIPSFVVNQTYVVSSEAEMLALNANVGDIAVRTDVHETLFLQKKPASKLENWIQALAPTDGVTSFNGQKGAIVYTPPVTSVNGKTGDIIIETASQNSFWSYANSADGTDGFTTVYPNLNLAPHTDLLMDINNEFVWGNKGSATNTIMYEKVTVPNQTRLVNGIHVTQTSTGQSGWRGPYYSQTTTASITATPNTKYTTSTWVKNNSTVPVNISLTLGLSPNVNQNPNSYSSTNINVPADGAWHYITYTHTTASDTNYVWPYVYTVNGTTSADFTFVGYKLELGSIATPHMPSASEVTLKDYPKYAGLQLTSDTKQSSNPSDYKWLVNQDTTAIQQAIDNSGFIGVSPISQGGTGNTIGMAQSIKGNFATIDKSLSGGVITASEKIEGLYTRFSMSVTSTVDNGGPRNAVLHAICTSNGAENIGITAFENATGLAYTTVLKGKFSDKTFTLTEDAVWHQMKAGSLENKAIPANTNLDTYVEAGMYNNSNKEGITGNPTGTTGKYFWLEVIANSVNTTSQRYHDILNNKEYIRSRFGTTPQYTDWIEVGAGAGGDGAGSIIYGGQFRFGSTNFTGPDTLTIRATGAVDNIKGNNSNIVTADPENGVALFTNPTNKPITVILNAGFTLNRTSGTSDVLPKKFNIVPVNADIGGGIPDESHLSDTGSVQLTAGGLGATNRNVISPSYFTIPANGKFRLSYSIDGYGAMNDTYTTQATMNYVAFREDSKVLTEEVNIPWKPLGGTNSGTAGQYKKIGSWTAIRWNIATTSAGNYSLGTIPDVDARPSKGFFSQIPVASAGSSETNHLQINEKDNGAVTILNALANKNYSGQVVFNNDSAETVAVPYLADYDIILKKNKIQVGEIVDGIGLESGIIPNEGVYTKSRESKTSVVSNGLLIEELDSVGNTKAQYRWNTVSGIQLESDISWNGVPLTFPSGFSTGYHDTGFQIKNGMLFLNINYIQDQSAHAVNSTFTICTLPNVRPVANCRVDSSMLPGKNAKVDGYMEITTQGNVIYHNYSAIPAQTGTDYNLYRGFFNVPINLN